MNMRHQVVGVVSRDRQLVHKPTFANMRVPGKVLHNFNVERPQILTNGCVCQLPTVRQDLAGQLVD